MSANTASEYVRAMIHIEANGPGDSERAMRRLENRYGVSYWTLDHLRKRRAKTIEAGLYDRVRLAFIAHCERKAKLLLEQAETALALGADDNVQDIANQVQALAARLAAAKGGGRKL